MKYTVELIHYSKGIPQSMLPPTKGELWAVDEPVVVLSDRVEGRTADGKAMQMRDLVPHWIRMGELVRDGLPMGFRRAVLTSLVAQSAGLLPNMVKRDAQATVTVERVLGILRDLDPEVHEKVIKKLHEGT